MHWTLFYSVQFLTKMLLFVFVLFNSAIGANILYISPTPAQSHHIWNRVLALALNEKGHNITMLTHGHEEHLPANFTLIRLERMLNITFPGSYLRKFVNTNAFNNLKAQYEFSQAWCKNDFTTQGLQTLVNYPKYFKFDVLIFDITFEQCLYPLIHRFNNPSVVAVTPFLLPPIFSYVWGNPLQPPYFSHSNMHYSDKMTFKERLFNFAITYYELLYRKYLALPYEMDLAKKYFGEDIPSFEDVERNMSILLSNSDPNLEYPVDLPPNIIPVGGLHVQPAKPLPQDLQQLVDNARNGVIIYSLGSFIKSDSMSEIKKRHILTAFSRVPATVICKFETDLDDVPKNVIIKKWLPQNDILAQPNVKLLISHGGALSTQEAMRHGVPIIAIPFYGDQFLNAESLEHKKIGKVVDFTTLTNETFYATIKEVLDNPIYRNNIKTLAKRYTDRLNTPLETAIFWIEYILRHGSAEHLNLAARDMYFYETANLDIFVFIILLTCTLLTVGNLLFLLCKLILKAIFMKTMLYSK
ncbi:hypothetical protein FQA39_LY04963 [Lamprigera yunnana]|nr:hypothetical protein FQA39_LY04963 [Lamprigera yunnana]